PRPSRNLGKSISTSRRRSSTASSWRTSSPASIRTETAFDWPMNASSETAGSSRTGSSRQRSVPSAIDRLLEPIRADPPIGVDETFARFADRAALFHRPFDRIDDPVFAEAGAGNLGLARRFVARSAQQELVAFVAFAI